MQSDRDADKPREIGSKLGNAEGRPQRDQRQADAEAANVADAAQDAVAKAKEAASDMADKATSIAEGAGATVQDAAQKIAGQASNLGGQVYQQAADAGRYAGRQIQQQPLAALLIAGCVGAAIGYLIGRESRAKPRTIRDYAHEALPRRYR